MIAYQPPKPATWTGRVAPDGDYWFQRAQCIDLKSYHQSSTGGGMTIIGYAVEEGVRRNQGRIGAAAGPLAIRKQLAKLADHLPADFPLYDIGDISCLNGNLAASHSDLSNGTGVIHQKKSLPVLLGGGHDIAYAHFYGTQRAFPNQKIGIINFDAHLDLRPTINGPTSGTPFYQIANLARQAGEEVAYLPLGIQLAATPPSLLQTAADFKVTFKLAEEMVYNQLEQNKACINQFIAELDGVCLTIDLDGFSSAYAPGVSAPSALGFTPAAVFPLFEQIAASGKLLSVDVSELNPTYDQDNITAKLAARCIERIVRTHQRNKVLVAANHPNLFDQDS